MPLYKSENDKLFREYEYEVASVLFMEQINSVTEQMLILYRY
jgi:hypothetical protein